MSAEEQKGRYRWRRPFRARRSSNDLFQDQPTPFAGGLLHVLPSFQSFESADKEVEIMRNREHRFSSMAVWRLICNLTHLSRAFMPIR